MKRRGFTTAALIAVVLFPVTKARAGDEQAEERRVHEIKQQIESLLKESEALRERGSVEDAAELREKAMNMKRELGAYLERRREKQKQADPRQVLEDLRRGMKALQQLGRNDLVNELERIHRDVAEDIEARERKREDGADRERRAAENQIELLLLTMRVMTELEKRDAADVVERAVHARKIALSGRKDEEARMIREKAPPPGQLADLVHVAGKHLEHKGHERNAEALLRYARELDRSAKKRAGGDERILELLEKTLHRLERVEARLEELEARTRR